MLNFTLRHFITLRVAVIACAVFANKKRELMAKNSKTIPSASFEQHLWDTANKLRGSVESSEYKHVVLSLIFLKFISDKFEAQRKSLVEQGMGDYVEQIEFYAKDNVFYLPEQARWSYIQQQMKQDDIAVKIDTALHTVEKNNPSLKGALPDNYFSRLGLVSNKLASLIDTINNIDTAANESGADDIKSEEDMLIAFSPARDATMKTYKQLTYEQRCQIYALSKTGMSQNKIAKQLNVSQSTISRKFFRNTGKLMAEHMVAIAAFRVESARL
jgi:predicted XRE-type DNA-binding protein